MSSKEGRASPVGWCVLLMLLLASSPAHAQQADAGSAGVDGGRSFVVEAVGAMAGTALGFGAIAATHRYGRGEDLSCTLRTAATAVVLGTVGSATGAYAAGLLLDTEPSGWGAVVGSIAGAVVAIGVDHLVTRPVRPPAPHAPRRASAGGRTSRRAPPRADLH